MGSRCITWSKALTKGVGPSARGGQTADVVGNLLVVFGGTANAATAGAASGGGAASSSGGGAKGGSSAGGGKVTVSGGFVYYNDVFALDLDASPAVWHKPSLGGTTHPPPRYSHGSCPIDYKVYVFGGKGAGGMLYNDLWSLDAERWVWELQPSTSAPPPARCAHSQLAIGGRVVVFGGWDAVGTAMNDLWIYDRTLCQWSRPKTTGPPPSPRQGASCVLDAASGRVVVFGGVGYEAGTCAPQYLNDVRELDLVSMQWKRTRVAGDHPPPRHWAGTCRVANVMCLIGGYGGPSAPKLPAAAAAAAAAVGGKVTIPHKPGMGFGVDAPPGSVIEVPFAPHPTTHLLDLDGDEWVAPCIAGDAPGYRYGSAVSCRGLQVFILGGWENSRALSELLVLDLSALAPEGGGGEAAAAGGGEAAEAAAE